MTGSAHVIRGDARHLPLPDESVDLIVTSPPYFALRSYTDAGEHYTGQIGSEGTPQEFIAALIECTREMVRVLKPSGSIFLNLGDKYAGGGGGGVGSSDGLLGRGSRPSRRPSEFPAKSLMLLPERFRIAAVDQLGLIARAVIVWDKPNGLPESVQDRVRRSHEDWVHLTKQPRYFSAVDEIREPQQHGEHMRKYAGRYDTQNPDRRDSNGSIFPANPLGKLPGSVWRIPTEPLTVPPELGVDHFAAYPLEWPLRLIAGWCPAGVCRGCGEGRRPVSATEYVRPDTGGVDGSRKWHTPGDRNAMRNKLATRAAGLTSITGYVCGCTPYTDHPGTGEDNGQHGAGGNHVDGRYPNVGVSSPAGGTGHLGNRPKVGPWREYHHDRWTPPPTTPGVVLDPFAGTGTTMLAAKALGRVGIGVDMSADYCRLAAWRCTDRGELAKAMRVEKPAPVPDGQGSIFDLADGV